MKLRMSLLITLIPIIAICSTASLLGFNKASLATLCFKYATGLGAITPQKVSLTTNWSFISTAALNAECAGAGKLCAICFDDGQFTGTTAERKQKALDVLADWLVNGFEITDLNDGQVLIHQGKTLFVYQREVE